jgi:hypothetical protein
VVDCLPVIREIRKMPRQYICNVIFTCLKDPFQEWVNERCSQRNADIAVEHNLNIELDANIAKAFHASTAVSRMYYLIIFKLILSLILTCFIYQSLKELVAS